MRPSLYPLEDVMPHRGKMLLLDEIVEFDREGEALTAAFHGRKEWRGGFAAIEYMAQAAAALAGSADRDAGRTGAPKPGFLLGTRRMTFDGCVFEPGRRYLARARKEFSDGEAASFACEVCDGEGHVLATATLNAYRPDNIAGFVDARKSGKGMS